MRKYKLRNARRKATFGIDGAIQAAAQLTATGLQIASDTALAKEQQRAMKESATLQADALKSQNENNNNLQQQSLEMIKDEKKRDRELQQDMQMTMQMQAARQNQRALQEANAIQVKNGGSAKRKLRNVGMHSSLRAGKIPGIVTPHQGNYVPIAFTQDGVLAMLTGPNHDNGGVDVDILGNKDIEAEGGELMHIKYALGGLAKNGLKDVQFISKHKLPGTNFNPKDAVMSGAMSPDEAFATQETIKDVKGIRDDGKSTPVRKKALAGSDYTTLQLPYKLINTLEMNNPRRLRYGGCRKKAVNGKYWSTEKSNLWGAGINAMGNGLSAIFNNIGNSIGSRYLTRGYTDATNTLIGAYNNIKGIDPTIISKSDFRSASPLAAIQTPTATASVENAIASRDYNRSLAETRRSGINAAAINRQNNLLGVNYQDVLSKNQAAVNRINQGIAQANMDRITDVSKIKAQIDSQNLRDWANTNLALLQYNNEIKNEKVTGIGQVKADMINSIAGVKSATARQNWSNIGNAINAGANAFGSAFQTNARMQNNLDYAMLGASDDSVIRWIDTNPDNPNARRYAKAFWRRYRNGSGNYRTIADRYQQQFGF